MTKRLLLGEEKRKNVAQETIETYVATLKKMVDCKTVYTKDHCNQAEYDKFYQVLEEAFPLVHKNAKRMTFGSGCFIYVIEGKNAKRNVIFVIRVNVDVLSFRWNSRISKNGKSMNANM